MLFSLSSRLIRDCLDIIVERVVDAKPPSWSERRGWSSYLLALDEARVHQAEMHGIAAVLSADPSCPSSLVALAEQVDHLTDLPRFTPDRAPSPAGLYADTTPDGNARMASLGARQLEPERAVRHEKGTGSHTHVSARKLAQVDAFAALLSERFRHVTRVVDVGAGHGHLTRRVAVDLGVEAIGLERDVARVAVGRALAKDRVQFVALDVLDDDSFQSDALGLDRQGLLMALHGCGALGDRIVRTAIETRAHLVLVSCCPQKIRAEAREPWIRTVANFPDDPVEIPALPREVLGLANVLPRVTGVERPMVDELRAREARVGLRILLERRGVSGTSGDEMRGVNRRRARAGLDVLASAALSVRGLAPASTDELDEARRLAAISTGRSRRLSLPRTLLGRAVETYIALDRATYLERSGFRTEVVTLFDLAVSPRNIAVLAIPS